MLMHSIWNINSFNTKYFNETRPYFTETDYVFSGATLTDISNECIIETIDALFNMQAEPTDRTNCH